MAFYTSINLDSEMGNFTILALPEITEHIYDALDKGKSALGLYLDLTKAFDIVGHSTW